ncbi:MAG: hypothetical protein ACOC3E_00085 [Cyanobacteriota bacterium]
MLAMLIAQDLALGFMLAMLPALNDPSNIVSVLGVALIKALVFLSLAIALPDPTST